MGNCLDLIEERIEYLQDKRKDLVEEEGRNKDKNLHYNAQKIQELRKLRTKIKESKAYNHLFIDEKSYEEGRTSVIEEFREIIEDNKPLKEPLKSEIKKLFGNLLYDYLNHWADLDSGEYDDIKSTNGYKTPWAKGYRQAVMDISEKMEEIGMFED